MDKRILQATIEDLKNNPNACGVDYDSIPSDQLSDFIHYMYKADLTDKNYLENYDKIRNKTIADYTYEDTLTALTRIIRGERFCSGSLYSCVQSGEVLSILERMAELNK